MSSSVPFSIVPVAEAKDQAFFEKSQPMVLVVDDERIIADTLSIILAKGGYDVLTAYNGSMALELAQEMPPDLLLSDVMMPGMTGIELAIVLTEAIPQCKVLLFSGQAATAEHLVTAHAMGHDFNVLTKPVHPSDILRHIAERLADQAQDIGILAIN